MKQEPEAPSAITKSAENTRTAKIVLGIESTAHTFGIGIIRDKAILSNITRSHTTSSGGMIPAKVALHHEEAFLDVLNEALAKAGVAIKDVDLIAFSKSPGLGNALRVGASAAKSLALQLDIPLIGVNHCIAHLEISRLVTPAKDPILLYCSGANTQIIAYDAGKYRIFGETLDSGIGNFLDTLARDMGLGFPGGPKIEELALNAQDKNALIQLPYSVKGMDVAFSGLQTHLLHKIKSGEYTNENIAYSVQETVFAMLVEVSERALAHAGKNELVLGGGVACNKRLQEMCRIMCQERGCRFYCPENQLLVDNAAMIAWCGKAMYDSGVRHNIDDIRIDPYERTDEVEVTWR